MEDRSSATRPERDVIVEARRLGALCESDNVTARLLGGVGIAMRVHGEVPEALQRAYADLDYVVQRSHAPKWRRLLETHGYTAAVEFNALHGSQRLLHYDSVHDRQIDTFVGVFEMCHNLEFVLPATGFTLALADLLLTKLQIVQVNDKDLLDVILLLVNHRVGEADDSISVKRIQQVVGADWGWFTTLRDNLEKLTDRLTSVQLPHAERQIVRERIDAIVAALDAAPRSLRWRARAAIGRRLPWYVLPEEPDRL